jgi:hypothetical protein
VFKVETSGETMKVTRTLELPKAGNLPSVTLRSSYTIKFNLAGVKPGSDVGKAVLSSFEKTYLAELKHAGAKQDSDFVKAWKDLGQSIAGSTDKETAQKTAAAFEKKVIAAWNDFSDGTGRRTANASFASAVKEVHKARSADLAKARIDFSAEELKPARVNILTAILGALTLGVVAGPVGWVVAAVGGVALLLKGYQGAWEIAKRRAGDLSGTLSYVDDRLKEAKKAVDLAAGGLDRLGTLQRALEAELVVATNDLDKLRSEVSALAARATKEKAVREGGLLEKLRSDVDARSKALKALRADIGDITRAIAAVETAQKAVTQADKIVTSERKGWDGLMASVTKHSSDTGSMISTATTVLKSLT